MNKRMLKYIAQLFCVVMIIFPTDGEAAQVKKKAASPITIRIKKATSLINSGKAAQAYKLLLPYEYKYAGNTDFDYLFGVAALESGHPVKASLALERVLLMKPGFAGARVDLARAYYTIGNYLKARQEFTAVMKLPDPPQLVKSVVQKYMAMIEERLSEKKTRLSGWLELTGGYDSNVNYATEESVIEIPALNLTSVTLSEDNVETDSAYLKTSINLGLLHEFTSSFRSYVGINGSKNFLKEETQFEKEDAKLRAFAEFGENRNIFRIGAVGGASTLDQRQNSRQIGGNIEWRHKLKTAGLLTFFSQYDTFRYPDVEANNFDQWLGGLSWVGFFSFMKGSMIAASSYGGYASETETRADGDNTIYGIRVGCRVNLISNISCIAGIGGQFTDYKRENGVFLEKREDRQFDSKFALDWRPVKCVSIGATVNHIENDSNLPIYDYKRTDVSATIRYYFF